MFDEFLIRYIRASWLHMLKLIMFLKIDVPAKKKKKEITNTYDGVPFLVMLQAVGH